MPALTALAIVVMDQNGRPIPGTIAYLRDSAGAGFLFAITNNDGYAVWSAPLPFTGVVQLAGAAQYYEQSLTNVTGENVTLRVGPSPSNPQDIQLPAAVPFV